MAKFEAVLAATVPGDPNHATAAANTANAYISKFELTGRPDALERAIVLLDEVEPVATALGDHEADFFSILGHALLREAERTGSAETADRAVAARGRALELTGRNDEAYGVRQSDLAAVLATSYRIGGDEDVLREAIRMHEAGIRRIPAGEPSIPVRMSHLGTCLDDLAIRTGDLATLQRAVEIERSAVEFASLDDLYRPMIKTNLGIALEHLYEETGSLAALNDSVAVHREAVEETPEQSIDYWPRKANLGVSLLSLYERTGDLGFLEDAIDIFKLAVERTPESDAIRFRYIHDLASALMRLAERTGDLSGVDEAMSLWQVVVDATPDDHPAKPGRLSALATAGSLRFRREPAEISHLDHAIGQLRQAIELIPDGHVQQTMLLTNLGGLLDRRFEHIADPASLEEAIRVHRRAVALTPRHHSNRGPHLSNLGIALLHKARNSESTQDVGTAIGVLRDALEAITADNPGRALTLHALGAAHARAFELGDARALDEGLVALREAAEIEGAPLSVRIRANRDRGQLAASARKFDEALDGFTEAVRMMEEAAWAGMGRADQQRLLTELNGLPMDAAATAIEVGHIEEAIDLLERGRGVLLARLLEVPGLHAQLASREPGLAEELAWVQNALDASTDQRPVVADSAASGTGAQLLGTADRRNRLARRRAEILGQIRSRPELQDLASPQDSTRLRQVASYGPVVIVNISQYRCDALILSKDQQRLVTFAELTAEELAEQVEQLLAGADAASRPQVSDVLRWTWDRIVEPVLSDLGLGGHGAPPPGEEIHVWWCATGLSAFLPLHAAGYRSDQPGHADALELVVSSYTPTLRTLLRLRERQSAPSSPESKMLIVSMPHTPGQNDLESPKREAAYLAGRLPRHTLLTGPEATREAVATAMPGHKWAHFSCHGSQDLKEPDRAALHLQDGRLTIPQIMSLKLTRAVFAYLSACDTSRGGTEIPDEAITLATALQIAGYKHVIATLWQISGLTATEVVRRVYDRIITESDGEIGLNADAAASALRAAIRSIRDESAGLPAVYWAAHIHTGP
jgi:tetratricopeptide (TPR) repeat protein